MSVPQLFVGKRPIRLGTRIGKGGEGEIYLFDGGADQALKLYTVPDVLTRQPKIVAMIRAGLARGSRLVAYPSEIVTDASGRFSGFVMRLVRGHQPIHHLYGPADRKANFPAADYRFLVRSALNVARALADVHARSCVIGDINHSGILVSDNAMVALIDADSFQVTEGGTEYLCKVGVPEYTPPELQGRSLAGVRRTPNHDAFGLAVIVFQLLFMGRHPFVGSYLAVGDMPMEKAIAEYRFAYSRGRSVGMRPPPGTALLSDFPPPVAQAFETAFDRGASRPSAADWVEILERFETQLRRCADNDLHYFPSAAPGCPWCRMERAVPGLVLFLPPVPTSPSGARSPATPTFDLASVWAAIEAVQLPAAVAPDPVLPRLDIVPTDEAAAAARGISRRRGWGIVLVASAFAGQAAAPAALLLWLGLGGAGLFALLGRGLGRSFRDRAGAAEVQWTTALSDWERRCGGAEVLAAKQALVDARKKLEALPGEHRAQLANYEAHRREFQMKAHLERHRLATAKIPGVGPRLKAALGSWGIHDAADVTYASVMRVDGVGNGKATALVAWRRIVEARFSFDPRPNAADARERDRINREIAAKGEQLRARLRRGASDLRGATQSVLARWRTIDQPLVHAHAERVQARIDDRLVNPTFRSRLASMGAFAWAVFIMSFVTMGIAIFDMSTQAPRVAVPKASTAKVDRPAIDRFDPPRRYVVSPGPGIASVNVRNEPGGDKVVEQLRRGNSISVTGRSVAADGAAWLAFTGKTGAAEFVSGKLVRPAKPSSD